MSVTINGTTGVSLVQNGVLTDANMPAGSVIQVVQGNATTESSFTSTSFISTTTTASITPSSATSKILVIAYISIQAGSSGIVSHTIFRNSTDLGNGGSGFGRWFVAGSDVSVCMAYLDSPATTSSTTYDIRVKTSAATAYYNVNNSKSSIILMEIAA